MNIPKFWRSVALSLTVSVLIAGCTTSLRPSRLPEIIDKLEQHDFSEDERLTIGELLHYINKLENEL